MRRVIIFGAGPAGLLAAHAAAQAQLETLIYSIKQKSVMPGAQFLHQPIEGLSSPEPDGHALFFKVGTREGYARKVYGDEQAPCSWDAFPAGQRPVWSMGALYDKLWDRFGDQINDVPLDSAAVDFIRRQNPSALILSTVPAHTICNNGFHVFDSRMVWIRTNKENGRNAITYNGLDVVPWYRQSCLFGHHSREYGHQVNNAITGLKPIHTNCDCHPDIVRLGRFGRWKKGVLIHDAYQGAKEAICDALL